MSWNRKLQDNKSLAKTQNAHKQALTNKLL